jgi:CheY-like chemotaxis protein
MDGTGGLGSGSKVAVVGGGIGGAATACALLSTGRARGRPLEVTVYAGASGRIAPPALLTPECRSRLSALGCRIPPEWRGQEIRAIEIVSGHASELLQAPAGGLWVIDSWPHGEGGQRLVSRALLENAASHGARVLSRRVDQLERQPPPLGPAGKAPTGNVVVRSGGSSDRFHAAAIATGAGGLGRQSFLELSGAPAIPAVQARLRFDSPRLSDSLARLLLSPMAKIDGLYLIPCAHSVYALGYGAEIEPADLCQALMAAARDGLLAEGFEICELEPTFVPAGVGRRLCGPSEVAVGPGALGHPLTLGLADTLAAATRAAHALVEASGDRSLLKRRYVRDGIGDLIEDAQAATRAAWWLRHCGPRAAKAFESARKRSIAFSPFSSGVLGLPSPTPLALLGSARWAGIRGSLGELLTSTIEPLAPAKPVVEPDLFYVVDDDPGAREAIRELIESQGAKVVCFADELALYCAVARRPPTAILLDVVLAWVDGLRLCEGLKQHPLTRGTEVIVMSGLNRPHIRQRALDAGARAFMAKPVDADALLALLGLTRAPAETHASEPVPYETSA